MFLILIQVLAGVPQAPADGEGRTVWQGVYTDAQAARGRSEYEANCIRCHRGGPRTGDEFRRDWSGSEVEALFNQIKASMPSDAPSSLSDAAYLDIVTYVLQVNAFPGGAGELRAGALKGIRIEGRTGPDP